MWGNMSGYGWGGMGLGMLLFWALLIAGIVMLVRSSGGSCATDKAEPKKSALDLLKERYTRGEIERDEFEQKKRDLSE